MRTEQAFADLDGLVEPIEDGAMLAVPAEYCGVAMAATRALLRRGVRDLHLLNVPQSGVQTDLLIGAGAVATLETSGVTFGERGAAPRFVAAVKAGTLTLKDSTCPAIHAALQAAEKGLPFMPLRGLIGSDVLRMRGDWRVIDNPLSQGGRGDPIVVLPALKPNVALFHAPLGDRYGNVWIGLRRELLTMAHAARRTLVTVEEVYDGDLLADERMAAGTVPALYVTACAHVPSGAWPLGLPGVYGADEEHLRRYLELAASEDGFHRYLDEFVYAQSAAA